jgi:microcystin-dependent protein
MPTSQYLPFAIGGGVGTPNTLTPGAYAALTTLLANGCQPGIAKSEEVNTTLRQATVAAAGVAKFAVDNGPNDCLDDGSTANFAAAVKAAIEALITARQFWVPGDVKGTLVNVVPEGWLKANGQVVSRSTYAALFAAIGTAYGVGDGTTTFQLPDLRGEFLRGWDDGRGVDAARALGTAQADMVEAHKHVMGYGEAGPGQFGQTTNSGYEGSNATDTDNFLYNTNDGTNFDGAPGNGAIVGPETRPRNVAVLWLIRT